MAEYINGMKIEDNISNAVKPNHYRFGKIVVWDFIADQNLNFFLGNAIKYICRAGKKDSTKYVEDLQKAICYLQKEISIYEERGNDGGKN